MREERKNYTPEEKVAILRRHLIDNRRQVACENGHTGGLWSTPALH